MQRTKSAGFVPVGKNTKVTHTQQYRSPRVILLIVIPLLLSAGAIVVLTGMWHETSRREAYLPELEAQATHSPDDGRLASLLGTRHMEAGEYGAAADDFRQAIAAGESSDANWQALAANVAATGDRAKAIADLRLGLKALPASAPLQEALAQARTARPDLPPPALAIAISPHGPQELLPTYAAGSRLNGLAEWWGRHHPEKSGFATRQAWTEEEPNNAQAQRLWGQALLQNRRVAEAEAVLTHAIALAPNSLLANLALADSLLKAGDAPKAQLRYLTCLKLRPDWLQALLGFGASALQNGLTGHALKAYTRATQTAPQSADAWIGLGTIRLRLLAPGMAVEAFNQVLHLAPDRTDYLDGYWDALRQSGRGAEAEAQLRRRLSASPGDALAHYLLALVLRDTNPTSERLAEAEQQCKAALQFSPHNPLASVLLGQMLLDKGQTREAIAQFTNALSGNPYDQKTLLILARAYQGAGQPKNAAKVSARAKILYSEQQQISVLADQSRKAPLNLDLHRQLTLLYTRTGEAAKARREASITHLLETNPKQAAQEMNAFEAAVEQVLPGH